MGCNPERDVWSLDLAFGSYESSPAVVTHLSFEQPLHPIPATVASSAADVPGTLGGRTSGASVLSPPSDQDRDGAWTIRVQWVELVTSEAYQATAVVPVERVTILGNAARIGILIGPDGELLIASDEATPEPSGYHDMARVCGMRVPEADEDLRRDEELRFRLAPILDPPPPPVRDPFCPGAGS